VTSTAIFCTLITTIDKGGSVAELVVHLPTERKMNGLNHHQDKHFCIQKMTWAGYFKTLVVGKGDDSIGHMFLMR
jgi:hypothetical protein